MKNIEDENNPVIGETYLVACYVKTEGVIKQYTPVLNLLHSDIENGQKEPHYHHDTRFSYCPEHGKNLPPTYEYKSHFRIVPQKGYTIEYLPLILQGKMCGGISPVSVIRNAPLNHKCIMNGVCPHKGYSLKNILPVDGVIECPLHGLKFDAETGELLTDLDAIRHEFDLIKLL